MGLLISLSGFSQEELPFHGYLELGYGARTEDSALHTNDYSLNDARFQLDFNRSSDKAILTLKLDFLYDGYDSQTHTEVREANLNIFLNDIAELKVGRQIITWGTGDMLFINDVFPKDWVSYFAGRDDEYLKAPSNTILYSLFPGSYSLNIAWTPEFTPSNYITGRRFSYFNGVGLVGENNLLNVQNLPDKLSNSELALRLTRNINSYEYAYYVYQGFFKRPMGVIPGNPATNTPNRNFFPELFSYGASIRGPWAGGIANVEVGYRKSEEDSNGTNFWIPNNELRYLVGYERELKEDFTMGLQYYVEQMDDYAEYITSLPAGMTPADEVRRLVTLRLTRRMHQQTMTASLFTYYSPTDKDFFVRPRMTWNVSDEITFVVGANIFGGQESRTFFGQLQENDNVYMRVRYSY